MRVRFILLTTLVAVLVAVPVLAGFAGTDVFLPMVGRNVGVYPSNWYTTVWIYNPQAETITARLYFLERNKVNLAAPWVDVTVAGGVTEKLDNTVEALFHVQVFGAIRVTAPEKIVVTSRVYSKIAGTGEQESMGQDFAGVPAEFAIGLNEKSQILGCYQTLPTGDSEIPYNFGFVETTGHQATVKVTARDTAGIEQGSTSILVREYSQKQMAFKDYFPTVSTENTRLEIEVTAGSGRVIGYGSGIANLSQDPTTFEMQYADKLLRISTVQHDATLTGDGTASAPLGLADAAVSKAKLAASGGTTGQVLATDGSTLVWQDDALRLPYHAVSSEVAPFFIRTTNTSNSAAVLGVASASGTYATFPGTAGVSGYAADGRGVAGLSDGAFAAVEGRNDGSGGGVRGDASFGSGVGVTGVGAGNHGVYGGSQSADGVRGESSSGAGVRGASMTGRGVHGGSNSSSGVFGVSLFGTGVEGETLDSNSYGVYGHNNHGTGVYGEGAIGVQGRNSSGGTGVYGISFNGTGVYGTHALSANFGYLGSANEGVLGKRGDNSSAAYLAGDHGVYARCTVGAGRYAGYFSGPAYFSGAITKPSGGFKIDHPLDPENKYLWHSFVESPEMKNVYDGNVVLDAIGEAVVELPDWFEALNRDFRYQLTPIGAAAVLYVADKIKDGRFRIAGGRPGMEVSWQVTGIRLDPWANAHRIPVEEDKPANERGSYLHPDLYGQPEEKSVEWARYPEAMKRMKPSPEAAATQAEKQ